MVHYTEGQWKTTFIARLSSADAPNWLGNRSATPLGKLSSRVSPNGRYLAFMSKQPLTGYENVDPNPEAKGARDEEAFLYDSASAPPHLTCVSCNPGGPPHGVTGNGEHPLLVDGPVAWSGRWIAAEIPGWIPLSQGIVAGQSRYLSDQGRMFFNANDALVPQDTNAKMDVYEFEPAGLGSCDKTSGCVTLISSGTAEQESAFIDATPSGNDAFFISEQQLLSSDVDHSYDLYDARVCTEASPCLKPPPPPPPPCASEEECRPPRTSPPASGGSPASATNSLPGNAGKSETLGDKTKQPPKKFTKRQKLERALRACRKNYKHNKKKRALCERRAQHTYGAKKSSKSKRGKR
jgi:hypothetical protein